MNYRSRDQTGGVVLPELLLNRCRCQRGQNAGSQQIDGVPDAVLRDQAKNHCDDGHCNSAGDSAVNARPIGVDFHRDPDAVATDAGRQVVYRHRTLRNLQRAPAGKIHQDSLFLLPWQDVEPPSGRRP